MALGDSVEVWADVGEGDAKSFTITADLAGRTVEVVEGPRVIQVNVLNRNGAVVRRNRFLAARVVALLEHTQGEGEVKPHGTAHNAAEALPGLEEK